MEVVEELRVEVLQYEVQYHRISLLKTQVGSHHTQQKRNFERNMYIGITLSVLLAIFF